MKGVFTLWNNVNLPLDHIFTTPYHPRVIVNTWTNEIWFRYEWYEHWQKYSSLSDLLIYLEDKAIVMLLVDPVAKTTKVSNFVLHIGKTGDVVHVTPLDDKSSKICNLVDFQRWLLPKNIYDHSLCLTH